MTLVRGASPGPPVDSELLCLLKGEVRSARLPSTIDLAALTEGLDDLCARSLDVPWEDQVEWGACIVLDAGGVALVHQVGGTAESVEPLDEPDDHAEYVGFAHVHLGDPVTRRPYIGFSMSDFQGSLLDGDALALVCNGPDLFALVRTADCSQPPRGVSDWELTEWQGLYESVDRVEITDEVRGESLNRALWEANRELCRRLGFAFYRGERGRPLSLIFRPGPTVDAKTKRP